MKRIFLAVIIFAMATVMQAQAAHRVDLTATDTGCTAAQSCTLQVYRAAAACPASGIGTLTYSQLASAATGTATASTTTWTYSDTAVTAGQTYCYYVTATYTVGTGGPSGPSATFQGTIPAPPMVPTLSGVVQ